MVRKQTSVVSIDNDANRSEGSDFLVSQQAWLELGDGKRFEGALSIKQRHLYAKGEVVFNTGMTGYVESLSDPSYAGQILVFTYPLIGNYGVQLNSLESSKIQVDGVVVSELATKESHAMSDLSLSEWLTSQGIPVLTGVDTRALTKYLRQEGTMLGTLGVDTHSMKRSDRRKTFLSIDEPVIYNKQYKKKVILVDCGCKENILRMLLTFPVQVKRVPYNYDYSEEEYDGVLLSNGPGDPKEYADTIGVVKKVLSKKKPVFGICLGNQLLGSAAGARTYKLKYGHRGHNQPCLENKTKRGFITSQNHGYALDESSLPRGWRVSFRNLNDESVEGIEHTSKPFFSVQFHPEACPGPTDTAWLFERFYDSL